MSVAPAVRIATYNILTGGYNLGAHDSTRKEHLLRVIRAMRPDLVGIVESSHPLIAHKADVLCEIADTLQLQLIMNEAGDRAYSHQVAILTSLPVTTVHVHDRPGILHKPILEVGVVVGKQQMHIFLVHLAAIFNRYWAGQRIRRREVQELLLATASCRERRIPHIIMGDFNSIAPSDPFRASNLLHFLVEREQTKHKKDGLPYLAFVLPRPLRWLQPLLPLVSDWEPLMRILDPLATCFVPHESLRLLLDYHYTDCYRSIHLHECGFTYPAGREAGRIDFILACPELTPYLRQADVFRRDDDMLIAGASDHLPLVAEFVPGNNAANQ